MPLRGAARCAAQRGALGRLGGALRGAASIRQRVPGRGWRTIAPATSGHGVSIGELTREAAVPDVAASNPTRSTETDADAQLRQIFPLPLAVCPGFTLWAVRTVLPHGFPTSVSGNYLRYVRWTTLGLLSGRVQSVLATQAALVAVGLGAGAIPVAATVQWILKDGVGHLAAIGYASAVNTRFDADARRFRYQSTCALSIADFIAAAMPLWPHHFLLLASISSATKSIASIAQVSARARIMASFARRGNLADVTRAGQTQSKLASLIGTGLGAGLAWVVGSTPTDVFCCMVPLSCLSLYAMHRSSREVILRTFTLPRAEYVFDALVRDLAPPPPPSPQLGWQRATWNTAGGPRAPTPAEVAGVEPLFFGWAREVSAPIWVQPLVTGRSWVERTIDAIAGGFGYGGRLGPAGGRRAEPMQAIGALVRATGENGENGAGGAGGAGGGWHATWHADGAYAIAYRPDTATWHASPVVLWYDEGAAPAEKLRGVWHACVLRHLRAAPRAAGADAGADADGGLSHARALDALAHALWPAAEASLRAAGWRLATVYLDGEGGSLSSPEAARKRALGRVEQQHVQGQVGMRPPDGLGAGGGAVPEGRDAPPLLT